MVAPVRDGDALSDALNRLTHIVLDDASLDSVMQLVIALAVASLPGSDAASVSVLRDDGERFATINSTSPEVLALDQVQYDTGQGPCVTAIREGRPQMTTLDDRAQHWPDFVAAARGQGVTSIFSSPLAVGDRTIGGLNLYSHAPGSASEWESEAISTFATSASVVLANMAAYATSANQNEHLQRALQTRDLIGQAKGILMQRYGEDADQAFDRLRRLSQDSNRKLHDIAEAIVTSARDGEG